MPEKRSIGNNTAREDKWRTVTKRLRKPASEFKLLVNRSHLTHGAPHLRMLLYLHANDVRRFEHRPNRLYADR